MDSMIIPVINKLLCAEPPLFFRTAIVFFTAYFLNYLTFLVINIFCIYFFKMFFYSIPTFRTSFRCIRNIFFYRIPGK